MGSSLLFSPIIAYCLNIWRHRFLHAILYLALILNFLLLLVLHWFYWHLYLRFYIIAVIIHFKAQMPIFGFYVHLITANVLIASLLLDTLRVPVSYCNSLIYCSRPRISHFSKEASLLSVKMVFGDHNLCT